MCCHILRGDYARVASLLASSKPLGWSYSDNLNALAVPFLLYLRWNQERPLRFHRECYYHEPYNGYIKSLLANPPASSFVLSAPPADRSIYDDGCFRLLQLR